MRTRHLTIGKVRSALYGTARLLGDISAVKHGPRAVGRRVLRRLAGRTTGRFLGWLFR